MPLWGMVRTRPCSNMPAKLASRALIATIQGLPFPRMRKHARPRESPGGCACTRSVIILLVCMQPLMRTGASKNVEGCGCSWCGRRRGWIAPLEEEEEEEEKKVYSELTQ